MLFECVLSTGDELIDDDELKGSRSVEKNLFGCRNASGMNGLKFSENGLVEVLLLMRGGATESLLFDAVRFVLTVSGLLSSGALLLLLMF